MMKRVIIALSLSVTAMALPAFEAASATTNGRAAGDTAASSDNGDMIAASTDAALVEGRKIGGCVVDRHAPLVQFYLSVDGGKVRDVIRGQMRDALIACHIDSDGSTDAAPMRLSDAELQGLFAQEYLNRLPTSSTSLPVDPSPSYAADWVSHDPAQAVVDRMAICVAATQPAAALTLVRSAASSSVENSAFVQLMPQIGGCLVKGATLKGQRSSIRLAIAKALYHREYGSSMVAQLRSDSN